MTSSAHVEVSTSSTNVPTSNGTAPEAGTAAYGSDPAPFHFPSTNTRVHIMSGVTSRNTTTRHV